MRNPGWETERNQWRPAQTNGTKTNREQRRHTAEKTYWRLLETNCGVDDQRRQTVQCRITAEASGFTSADETILCLRSKKIRRQRIEDK